MADRDKDNKNLSPTATIIIKYIFTVILLAMLYLRISFKSDFSYIRLIGLALVIIILTADSLRSLNEAKRFAEMTEENWYDDEEED